MAESEPIVIAQPSTKTNNNSLNGSEINIGESIIIPSDIRMDAITISITRNGKKIRKPISNAVLSSEVIKAGRTMGKGIDYLSINGPSPDISANKFNVSTLVLVTINSFIIAKP